jgi:hypothetical protein
MDVIYNYRIDKHDLITSVSDSWHDFYAHESDDEPKLFVGVSIWNGIGGDGTVALYKELFGAVRKSQSMIRFPFRCDAPSAKRNFLMEIDPLEEGGLSISTQLIKETPLDVKHHFVRSLRGAPAMTFRCSICNDLKRDDRWLDIEEAFQSGLMEFSSRCISVAYTVCPRCQTRVKKLRESVLRPSG